MIRSFADPETERIWLSGKSRRLPPDIQQTSRRKLRQIDSADRLDDLAMPRGNRLDQLKGFTPTI